MVNTILNETKAYRLSEINHIIGGILNSAEEDIIIKRLAPPALADEETLALAVSEEEIANLASTKARAAVVPLGASQDKITTIEVERPRLAMMKLLHLFYIPVDAQNGVHETAFVDPTAKIGANVSIGANAFIGRGCSIGDNTKILPNTYIGKFSQIGTNCLFHAGVNIGDSVKIGNNVIIHHGASLGADGYSFVTENPGTIESAREQGKVNGDFSQQKIYKIPSLGSVTIGDDVEIGANTCIDSGTIVNTTIGKGTKIDDLVMIGHNCQIGENCLIVSQVGISGSVKIGDRTVLAGQVGIADHVNIGADSIVMAQSGVSKSFPDKSIIMGSPAMLRKEFVKQLKGMKDAGKLSEEVKALRKEIEELKKGS